eukprot:CAMPEP_0179074242 /NCGR_PEP_ID=MMETSP0796-20121207/32986_1 /TAXON_ID=73915 /ORGANISM="Pyrodinium bahamense, Strain pbaha01" /LENGTH=64 /DNA_ID=CAMNT_0020771461 /DNA_START=50 /DNA_END=241 /DNA_ORIENTATION=-
MEQVFNGLNRDSVTGATECRPKGGESASVAAAFALPKIPEIAARAGPAAAAEAPTHASSLLRPS